MSLSSPRVIAQSEKWLVIDKPSGWLVIPGRPARDAIEQSRPVLKEWAEKQLGQALFVVHRIDLETSGVLVFARNEEAHREANGWFARHEVKKFYDLLAQGRGPRAPMARIAIPIEGAPSITQLEVRERFGKGLAFLGRARPLSGRRHQIRIHLAESGFPLLGDSRYHGPMQIGPIRIPRVALHAAKLELPSGEIFESPWPEDFSAWVTELREC
ncbi:MAG: RNA pseudouridine synthase [Oligoflexia bacterium]|nr:RNA pseudouridine synthase [Oligoflexia bacterium]